MLSVQCKGCLFSCHTVPVRRNPVMVVGAPLCHCSNRHIAEPEIIEEGEVFRRRRYEEESEEEKSEEEEVDEEVSPVKGRMV